jgi:peptidoglycan/LPS O-acetylase OafA/YrhL
VLHATALLVLGVGASIVAAHLMYILVERPAMLLSQRLRRAQRTSVAVGTA